MELIDAGISAFGRFVAIVLPEGPLRGFIVEGLIGGVGSVVIFLPQILLLFLFILILLSSISLYVYPCFFEKWFPEATTVSLKVFFFFYI